MGLSGTEMLMAVLMTIAPLLKLAVLITCAVLIVVLGLYFLAATRAARQVARPRAQEPGPAGRPG